MVAVHPIDSAAVDSVGEHLRRADDRGALPRCLPLGVFALALQGLSELSIALRGLPRLRALFRAAPIADVDHLARSARLLRVASAPIGATAVDARLGVARGGPRAQQRARPPSERLHAAGAAGAALGLAWIFIIARPMAPSINRGRASS